MQALRSYEELVALTPSLQIVYVVQQQIQILHGGIDSLGIFVQHFGLKIN